MLCGHHCQTHSPLEFPQKAGGGVNLHQLGQQLAIGQTESGMGGASLVGLQGGGWCRVYKTWSALSKVNSGNTKVRLGEGR